MVVTHATGLLQARHVRAANAVTGLAHNRLVRCRRQAARGARTRGTPRREGRGFFVRFLPDAGLAPVPVPFPRAGSCEGGRWELRAVLRGLPSSASRAAMRSVSVSIMAASRSISAACLCRSASFSESDSRYRGSRVMRSLTHAPPLRSRKNGNHVSSLMPLKTSPNWLFSDSIGVSVLEGDRCAGSRGSGMSRSGTGG